VSAFVFQGTNANVVMRSVEPLDRSVPSSEAAASAFVRSRFWVRPRTSAGMTASGGRLDVVLTSGTARVISQHVINSVRIVPFTVFVGLSVQVRAALDTPASTAGVAAAATVTSFTAVDDGLVFSVDIDGISGRLNISSASQAASKHLVYSCRWERPFAPGTPTRPSRDATAGTTVMGTVSDDFTLRHRDAYVPCVGCIDDTERALGGGARWRGPPPVSTAPSRCLRGSRRRRTEGSGTPRRWERRLLKDSRRMLMRHGPSVSSAQWQTMGPLSATIPRAT